jgi:hypothetical protein
MLPMKNYLTPILFLFLSSSLLLAQVRYTGEEYRDYYEWFHQYSQTPDFYLDGTQLISFVENTPVKQSPKSQSPTLGTLMLGQAVTNFSIPVAKAVFSEHHGYREQWFLVEACCADGNVYSGYVWGGFLAKSWQYFDLEGDGNKELIALGLSTNPRQAPEDIRASLKVIQNGKLVQALELEGICLFEDCGASSLLRVFDFNTSDKTIVFESSIFTAGCLTGIDKALVAWDGQQLLLIHRGEYTTGQTYASNPLYLRQATQTQICYYKNENQSYDPVWNCQTLDQTVAVP